MKVDGGLSFVVGPMGAGKTLFETRHGVATLLRGDFWVTNIPLGVHQGDSFLAFDERWADRVAFHVAPFSRRNRQKIASGLLRRYRYVDDLQTALWHAVPRNLRRPGYARARLGWDESLVELNSREWDGGRGKSKDDRAQLFENIPMLRKNNVAGFLLTQHAELLDKNTRRIANWLVSLQNQRENTRVLGMRVKALPPLFLAYWYQTNRGDKADKTVTAAKTERYFLTWHRHIYDTFGLYGSAAMAQQDDRIIWLVDDPPAVELLPRADLPALPAPGEDTNPVGLAESA